MRLIVQKYGGTSVGTPERIRHVAHRIAQTYVQGHDLVVVVSAMGHTTDELLNLAHQVSKTPPHREIDMLLTAGERISMALLSMALAELNVPAISLTGSQTGIITDQSHRRAKIKRILGDRVRTALSARKVAIIAGFQGVSETKEITTLGRGGSDTTAVALAAALKADACEIYTDVDGVYSADPRIVPAARLWKWLPHDLMVELAHCGAGVLHPRSVELAKQYQVPLWVKNSLNENEGTAVKSSDSITGIGTGMEDFSVVGVTADENKLQIQITFQSNSPNSSPSNSSDALSTLWKWAGEAHYSLIAPQFSQNELNFFTDREGEAEWEKFLQQLKTTGRIQTFQIHSDTIPLTVLGNRFSDGMALHEMICTLKQSGIPISGGCSSALTLTLGIAKHQATSGVQALHRQFIETKEVR